MPDRKTPTLPAKDLSELLDALGHEQHFGYVPFGKSGLHVHTTGSRVPSMLIEALQGWSGDLPTWDDERILSVFDEADALDLTVLAHELVHVIQGRSTAVGIYVDLAGDALVGSWRRLLAIRDDFDGSLSALATIASAPISAEAAVPEDLQMARLSLAALDILSEAGFDDSPLPICSALAGSRLIFDPNDGRSYLEVHTENSGEVERIALNYRLVSENIAYTIQVCLHNRFAAVKKYPSGIHPLHWLIQNSPSTVFYVVLVAYIDSVFDGTDAYHDRLAEVLLELALMYGAYISRSGNLQARPLALVLEALINAAGRPDAPKLDVASVHDLVKYCHNAIRRDKTLEHWAVEEGSYEELVDRLKGFVESIARTSSPAPWTPWRATERLLELRKGNPTLSSDLVGYPSIVLVEAALYATPIYSPDLVVAHSSDLLVLDETGDIGGLNLQEYDLHLVRAMLRGSEPRCPHNHGGVCRGVLYGQECDDSVETMNDHYPCGFFDHRAIASIASKTTLKHAGDSHLPLTDFRFEEAQVHLGIVGITLSLSVDAVGAHSRRIGDATGIDMSDPFLGIPAHRRITFERVQREFGVTADE